MALLDPEGTRRGHQRAAAREGEDVTKVVPVQEASSIAPHGRPREGAWRRFSASEPPPMRLNAP